MKDPKAKELSPLALWDLHYLRELDDSGFIDQLYAGRLEAGGNRKRAEADYFYRFVSARTSSRSL